MARKIRVGLLFGGRSAEHEISVRSARGVLAALDTKKFTPVLIGIDKNGTWLSGAESARLLETGKAPKKRKNLVPNIGFYFQ